MQFVSKELIDFEWIFSVGSVNGAQYVDIHLVFTEEFVAANYIGKTSVTSLVDAVRVVHALWTVDAKPDKNVILFEKLTPLIVQQRAVCLNGVQNALPGFSIPLNVMNGTAKEVDPQEGRLSALPCDVHFTEWLRFQELPNVGLEQLIGHAKPIAWIKHFFRQEETVFAIQIADCTGRFRENVKA
jgi:hypothetical protein